VKFQSEAILDIWNGEDTKDARRALPLPLHEKAAELLDRLNAATTPEDLRTPSGNRLEKLSGDRKGQWSIRINQQYRICFAWDNNEAINVEITDYHG
jgi:proteic killer suppression protein